MNFSDIYTAVLGTGDSQSFDDSDRTTAKNCVNARLGMLWNLEEWSFTDGTANVSVAANSNIVGTVPADFAVALDVFRADGCPLRPYEEYREFARDYIRSSPAPQPGTPEAFTVIGDSILVGPASNETNSGYLLAYEKAPTLLVKDSDVPNIPAECHMALVHGGRAELFALSNVLLADPYEQLWNRHVQAMQRKYLTAVRGAAKQTPAFRPGSRRGNQRW